MIHERERGSRKEEEMTEDKPGRKRGKTGKKRSFEKSLDRLEAIVSEMENESLDLEEMIHHFEEGQSLLEFCSKKLNEVERKIEMIVRKEGKVVAEPFGEQVPDDSENAERKKHRLEEEGMF